jgi:hypothetical protein
LLVILVFGERTKKDGISLFNVSTNWEREEGTFSTSETDSPKSGMSRDGINNNGGNYGFGKAASSH